MFSAYCKHRYIPVYSTDFPRNNGHPVCKSDFSSAPRFYRECYQFFAPFYRIFHLFYKLSPFWCRYFTLLHPVFSALFSRFSAQNTRISDCTPCFFYSANWNQFFHPLSSQTSHLLVNQQYSQSNKPLTPNLLFFCMLDNPHIFSYHELAFSRKAFATTTAVAVVGRALVGSWTRIQPKGICDMAWSLTVRQASEQSWTRIQPKGICDSASSAAQCTKYSTIMNSHSAERHLRLRNFGGQYFTWLQSWTRIQPKGICDLRKKRLTLPRVQMIMNSHSAERHLRHGAMCEVQSECSIDIMNSHSAERHLRPP